MASRAVAVELMGKPRRRGRAYIRLCDVDVRFLQFGLAKKALVWAMFST
jgi:hypothetical protein